MNEYILTNGYFHKVDLLLQGEGQRKFGMEDPAGYVK